MIRRLIAFLLLVGVAVYVAEANGLIDLTPRIPSGEVAIPVDQGLVDQFDRAVTDNELAAKYGHVLIRFSQVIANDSRFTKREQVEDLAAFAGKYVNPSGQSTGVGPIMGRLMEQYGTETGDITKVDREFASDVFRRAGAALVRSSKK